MSLPINVSIMPSQFPASVQEDLRRSLTGLELNHKFLYDSYKQAQKWLSLHDAYAPSRIDPNCVDCYQQSFVSAAGKVTGPSVHLIGLGCGGGEKESRLLRLLKERRCSVFYSPVDVSTAMVLFACHAASELAAQTNPVVCDLATDESVASFLGAQTPSGVNRLITFFGMIPNFEPDMILSKLASLLRPADLLLVSANLAPGADYEAGVHRILPLYDNALTKEWLLGALFDLGVDAVDGLLTWRIEPCPSGIDLLRLEASFCFHRERSIHLLGEEFRFIPGQKFRLFFSYRYTPDRLRQELGKYGMSIQQQWITKSGEEGVFLCAAS